MFEGIVPGRRPRGPAQHPILDHNRRMKSNDAHPEDPVIGHQTPVPKKKTGSGLFKFGVGEVKTKAVAASAETRDLHARSERVVDKSSTDESGSMVRPTLLLKGNQPSHERYPIPPVYAGRYSRQPFPRLPYTFTIYEAHPQSLVSAGLSEKETRSMSKMPSDSRGDEASDDMDWLDKFIREEDGEIARMLEEDRLLAEELQRTEKETLDHQPTDYTEESLEEIIRRIDAEEEAARLQELELLCAGDAELAAKLERQEQEEFKKEQRQKREHGEEEWRKIGVPILARQVNTQGLLNKGAAAGVEGIRPEMVEMLKRVKELFKQSLPMFDIHRIDLIVNPKLQLIYEQTRREFERLGRSTEEVVLFHGTNPRNVEPYSLAWTFLMEEF